MLWDKVHNETGAHNSSYNQSRNYYPFFSSLSSSYRLINYFIIDISTIVILAQSVHSPSLSLINVVTGNYKCD